MGLKNDGVKRWVGEHLVLVNTYIEKERDCGAVAEEVSKKMREDGVVCGDINPRVLNSIYKKKIGQNIEKYIEDLELTSPEEHARIREEKRRKDENENEFYDRRAANRFGVNHNEDRTYRVLRLDLSL